MILWHVTVAPVPVAKESQIPTEFLLTTTMKTAEIEGASKGFS
jgi:hypothetical protein